MWRKGCIDEVRELKWKEEVSGTDCEKEREKWWPTNCEQHHSGRLEGGRPFSIGVYIFSPHFQFIFFNNCLLLLYPLLHLFIIMFAIIFIVFCQGSKRRWEGRHGSKPHSFLSFLLFLNKNRFQTKHMYQVGLPMVLMLAESPFYVHTTLLLIHKFKISNL